MEPIAEERKSQLFKEEELGKVAALSNKNKSAREEFFKDLITAAATEGSSSLKPTLRVSGQLLTAVDGKQQQQFGSLGRSLKTLPSVSSVTVPFDDKNSYGSLKRRKAHKTAELANLLDHHQPTSTPSVIRFDCADHRVLFLCSYYFITHIHN